MVRVEGEQVPPSRFMSGSRMTLSAAYGTVKDKKTIPENQGGHSRSGSPDRSRVEI